MEVANALEDALQLVVSELDLVALQEAVQVDAVNVAAVGPVYCAEELLRVVVLAAREVAARIGGVHGVEDLLVQPVHHLALGKGLQGCVAQAALQARAQVQVGLRQQLLLEAGEGDAARAGLVDDALEQARLVVAHWLVQRGEEVLQLCPRNAAAAAHVEPVEDVLDGHVRVRGQRAAVALRRGVRARQPLQERCEEAFGFKTRPGHRLVEFPRTLR